MEEVGANFRREVLVEEPNVTKGDYDYAQVSTEHVSKYVPDGNVHKHTE
jgi:hypothetical protein